MPSVSGKGTGNYLTIHILAAAAENEVCRISERTKAALAAPRERGQLFGSARRGHWNGREDVRLTDARTKRDAKAAPVYLEVRRIIASMKAQGVSPRAVAERLDADGFTTLRGMVWNRI